MRWLDGGKYGESVRKLHKAKNDMYLCGEDVVSIRKKSKGSNAITLTPEIGLNSQFTQKVVTV